MNAIELEADTALAITSRFRSSWRADKARMSGHCRPALHRHDERVLGGKPGTRIHAFLPRSIRRRIASRCLPRLFNDRLGPFLAEICKLTGLDAALPMNTGAEAVETAIKAARRWGYRVKGIPRDRAEIIVANGNFHGRTTTVISFSSEPDYRDDFGPFTPGFRAVPFGDLAAVERAIGPYTAAVLMEPIQGEAGIIVPPHGFLAGLRRICDAHGVLLILDEVQSGLGRTGAWFAYEHEGFRPDGVILGKALGGGVLPVSAFVARREVMDVFTPGSHGSTFGGNPLAAAVGLEALCVIRDEGLVDRSAALGAHMLARLRALDHPALNAVRGRGLWVGAEIDLAVASAREVCSGSWPRACSRRRHTGPWCGLRRPLSLRGAISTGRSIASRRCWTISAAPAGIRKQPEET
jgi:ornithine--oxo-acid transaminase